MDTSAYTIRPLGHADPDRGQSVAAISGGGATEVSDGRRSHATIYGASEHRREQEVPSTELKVAENTSKYR